MKEVKNGRGQGHQCQINFLTTQGTPLPPAGVFGDLGVELTAGILASPMANVLQIHTIYCNYSTNYSFNRHIYEILHARYRHDSENFNEYGRLPSKSPKSLRGRLGDFFRCIKTTPGLVMVAGVLIGGPLASTAYVVGLQKAGSIIVPISALCPAVGAILGRVLFKQTLTPRMMLGIGICALP